MSLSPPPSPPLPPPSLFLSRNMLLINSMIQHKKKFIPQVLFFDFSGTISPYSASVPRRRIRGRNSESVVNQVA